MGRPTSDIRLTEFQRHVAVGTLLGDSSLSIPAAGRNFHLSCYHSIKQREWLNTKHAWLSPASRPVQWCEYLDKRDGKTRAGGRFHTVSIPCFTDLASAFYRDRTKFIGRALLDAFTHPVSLACLIGDDGSWDGAGIAINSKQFTTAENNRLARHLSEVFGLEAKTNSAGPYPFVRIPASSVERVRELCLPWLPASLTYKVGPAGYRTRLVRRVAKACDWCGEEFLSYASDKQRFCSRACSVKGRPYLWTGGRSSPRR